MIIVEQRIIVKEKQTPAQYHPQLCAHVNLTKLPRNHRYCASLPSQMLLSLIETKVNYGIMKSDKEYNEPMLAIESLSDGLSTATGS